MLHIYRQIVALKRVRSVVIAQKREKPKQFSHEPIYLVGKPPTHFLRRFWFRNLRDAPWQISRMEVDTLLRILAKTDSQLLHIYFGHIAVHLLPLIRAWPKPSVVSFHGADVLVDMDKPAYRAATEEMLTAVKRVFVRSESLRRAVTELGCDENKVDIVRTAIPLEEFPFRLRRWPRDGAWRLVQACRLIEKKGLETTLRAFAVFGARFPEATLTIAGEGPLLVRLQKLARRLGIDARVLFPGFVSQERLHTIFYSSHIFLHPSETGRDGNQEGIPNSMLEAMASGLPVFATLHGGIPEAIENRVNGVLVPERDHESLARELLGATQAPHYLERLARNATESVAQKFEQRAQVGRLEDLYLKMISRTD